VTPYADTNFFTRLYLALPESEQADRLIESARKGASPPLPITWLHRMELANAFELSVWLSRQEGHPRVTAQNSAVALETFKGDLAEETFVRDATVDISDIQSLFEATVARHTSKYGFRTHDILHVVSARILGCDCFYSFDERARKLAGLEGLKVFDV